MRMVGLYAVITMLLANPPASAGIEEGLAAQKAGDFKAAFKEFLAVARAAPRIQYIVGRMYYEGKGVDRNLAEAAKWYRKSASQGFPDAQYSLGMMYCRGKNVSKAKIKRCIYWLRRASAQGHQNAKKKLKSTEKILSIDNKKQKLKKEQVALKRKLCPVVSKIFGVQFKIGKIKPSEYVEWKKRLESFRRDCKASPALMAGIKAYFFDSKIIQARNSFSRSCRSGEDFGCHFLGGMAMFGKGGRLKVKNGENLLRQKCKKGFKISCDFLKFAADQRKRKKRKR